MAILKDSKSHPRKTQCYVLNVLKCTEYMFGTETGFYHLKMLTF